MFICPLYSDVAFPRTMDDLDLAVDDVSRAMSLTFEKCPGEVLHLDLPEAWKLLELTGFFFGVVSA